MVFPGRPRRDGSYESPRPTLFGFRFPPEYFPIHPSRRTSGQETPASPELWFPSAQASQTDPRPPGLPHPATFRLQGLVTLLAVYSPSGLGSLVSCCQRSWDFALRSFLLPRGFPPVSGRMDPHDVRTLLHRCRNIDRTSDPRLLGFDPPGNSYPAGRGWRHESGRMLPWAFPLSGYSADRLALSGSSRTLGPTGSRPPTNHASRSFNRRSVGQTSKWHDHFEGWQPS
jgi:hypothetical protein